MTAGNFRSSNSIWISNYFQFVFGNTLTVFHMLVNTDKSEYSSGFGYAQRPVIRSSIGARWGFTGKSSGGRPRY